MNKDGILSATLADIYLEQGYLEKAIEIYDKLSKREPENDVYRQRLASLRRDLREKSKLSPFRRAIRHKLW
jgi:tetratricopeptide (TPR) repeat protein